MIEGFSLTTDPRFAINCPFDESTRSHGICDAEIHHAKHKILWSNMRLPFLLRIELDLCTFARRGSIDNAGTDTGKV